MAARAGVESTTLRLEVIDSTKATPRPTTCMKHVQKHSLHEIV